MPASVSSSTVAPSASAASRPGSRACSTDSWKVTTRPVNVTPRSEASRCSRRVSSTARTSAVAITSRSRGPTSPGCPRGAPPSTSRPLTHGEPVTAAADAARSTYPGGMAVLAPERADGAGPERPAGAPRRPAAGRSPARGATAPRRCPTTAGCPGCSTAVLGVVTLASRLWGISYPSDLLFDEAYYPPEAHELLTWGFEYNRGYSFIVHPPLGKWLIAAGEQLFGYNSFGWRFPSAVAGAVAVVVLVRLARRLTGSTLLGPARRAAAGARRLLLHPLADRPARRLPAGARRLRGRLPGRRPRPGARTDPRGADRVADRVPARPARLADRRRRPVRLRVRGEVERRLVPRVLRRPLAVLGPGGLARGRRPAADPRRRCGAGCPGRCGRWAPSRC